MPTRVALDAETEAWLRRLDHPSGRTKPDVLREAPLRLSRQHVALEPAGGPCALIGALVRPPHGGPDDLARTRHSGESCP